MGKIARMDMGTKKYHRNDIESNGTSGPRFSIIIPVYNAEKYLDELFDSIEAQTFTDFEIIAVDDCSTDSSLSILKKRVKNFQGRMQVLSTPHNSGGCYKPRAIAARETGGEYIVPIDADDIVAPNFLEILDNRINQTNADLVYGVFMKFNDSEPLESAKRFLPSDDMDMERVCPGRERVIDTLVTWRIGTGGCYSRSLYLKGLSRADEIVSGSFSVETLTRILLCESRISALCEAVYYYRMNPISVTHKLSPRYFSNLDNDVTIYRFIRNEFGENSKESVMAATQQFLHIIDAIRKLNTPGLVKDSERDEIKGIISRVYNELDWGRIKTTIPLRSRIIMRSGLKPATFLYRFFDKLRKK